MSRFEDAFELTGHGRFNHLVLFTSGLVLLHTMMESLGVGYIVTAAQCDLHLTVKEKGMVNSAAFIGIMSTAIFWGYLSDRYGRRCIMLPAISAASAVSFASTFSMDFLSLFIMRFITGCLVSASSATVYAYVGEMHTNSRRASSIAWASTFISFTFIVLPVLAWLIIPRKWSFPFLYVTITPWRIFIWSWSLPGLLAAIILIFLPESPRYLLAVKGPEKALPVLATMYAWNHWKKREDYPVKSITTIPEHIIKRGFGEAFKNMTYLIRPPLLKCVFISHFSMFLVFMLSSGLYTWMPEILNQILYNVHRSESLCDVMMEKYARYNVSAVLAHCENEVIHRMVYPISIIMGILCALCYVVIGFLIAKYSKIWIYCITLAAASVLLAISGIIPKPIVSLILFIIGLCAGCAASVMAAITVEVFPTSVRALALCTLYMCARFGAAVGANLLSLAMYWHCEVVFLFDTLGTAGSTLLMMLWPDPKKVRAEMESKGFVY